jgi:putative transposase
MGRPLRNEAPGLHHVVTRGNNKRMIYEDDADRTLFCVAVNRIATRHEWRILAFVLMRNHYHLLIAVGDKGLSPGMCQLNKGHADCFNLRHRRVDHLFGKRYWSRPLTTDAMVQNAARYIVQNPRRAGIAQALEKYSWSSYTATVSQEFSPIRLSVGELLQFFGTKPASAIASYREFCEVTPSPAELEDPVPGTASRRSEIVHRSVA